MLHQSLPWERVVAIASLLAVAWSTGRRSARLRRQAGAGTVLLASRQLGKAALLLILIVLFSIRIGVAEQLYVALGVIGAAIAFAARRPIANAFAFAEMIFHPPFLIGDRVRISDFRGGEVVEGEVVGISLTTVTVRTKRRTMIVMDNARIGELRVEKLSMSNRRRLEFSLPILETIPSEKLRSACAIIEDDLRNSSYVSDFRAPHVWISGYSDGLRLKASAWLRQGVDRREAQSELFLAIRARFEGLVVPS